MLLLVSAGCGSGPVVSTSPGVDATSVTVVVNDEETATYTLVCSPEQGADADNSGDHPDVDSACQALLDAAAVEPSPLETIASDQLCTQVYGGDQTATITGVVLGEEVTAELSRVNGCEIARWDAMVPVVGTPGGVDDG